MPELAIAARPDAIFHVDRHGRIGTDAGLQLVGARGVDPRFARSKLGRCSDGPLDRLVERWRLGPNGPRQQRSPGQQGGAHMDMHE